MIPIHIIVYLLSIFLQHANINSAIESESWCHNQSAVLYLQREQLRCARISVFGEKHYGFLGRSETLNLYKHRNNKYTVELSRNANGYSHLIYRRLYKNANDHIRTLLYNYEQRLCKGNSKLSDKILKCIPNCDFSCPSANSYLNRMMKSLSTLFISAEEKNFSFTFVREPLSRFISGMTEVSFILHFYCAVVLAAAVAVAVLAVAVAAAVVVVAVVVAAVVVRVVVIGSKGRSRCCLYSSRSSSRDGRSSGSSSGCSDSLINRLVVVIVVLVVVVVVVVDNDVIVVVFEAVVVVVVV
jgi:hypothetical protein